MSTSLVIPSKLKLKKYRVDNSQAGSDIINANTNPIVINDTTAATTTATSYTQVKSYSGIGGIKNWYGKYMVNAIRVQVYGYVSAGTGYVEIEVDGATTYTVLKAITGTATGTSFTNTSSALLIDAIIELSASSSHTIAILAYNSTSGDSTTIAGVYGFQGYAITSTTLTLIDSETLNNYILDEIGFTYGKYSGIHAFAFVNRSTSATATLQFSDNFTPSGAYGTTISPGAGNDAANSGVWVIQQDNNNNESVPTGYNGSWSWNAYGEVGASGDVLLIGNLYIWFLPNGIVPPADLLVSVGAILLPIPSSPTSLAIMKNTTEINECVPNATVCYQNVYTIISASNTNANSNPVLPSNYTVSPIMQLTTDESISFGATGWAEMAFIEIEAIIL